MLHPWMSQPSIYSVTMLLVLVQELPVGGASQNYTAQYMLESRRCMGSLHGPHICRKQKIKDAEYAIVKLAEIEVYFPEI